MNQMVRFSGQSARDADAEFATPSRLVNCYIEPADGGREVLKSVLGSQAFTSLPGVFMRAMQAVNGQIMAACGGQLHRILKDGRAFSFGPISDGETVISSNNGKVTVAANGVYYVLDGDTLTQPTGFAFDDRPVGGVTFLNQHTILFERGGRRVAWSAVADPETFNGLDFASAEARDDAILAIRVINGQLVIFKEQSREVWYPTGSSEGTEVFARVAGGVYDTGLRSASLLVNMDQSLMFVGDDGIVYMTDGHTQNPVSNRALETALRIGQPRRCLYYEDEGHKFACITFADRPAWCFDVSTGFWHERENGAGIWTAVDSVKMGRDWFTGTEGGDVLRLVRSNVDGPEPLRRFAVSETIYQNGQRFRLAEIEAFARTGVNDFSFTQISTLGDADGTLEDIEHTILFYASDFIDQPAYLSVAFSEDDGQTWGQEVRRSLGLQGKYNTRALWRSRGAFRRVTMRLSWSTPGEVSVLNQVRVRLA